MSIQFFVRVLSFYQIWGPPYANFRNGRASEGGNVTDLNNSSENTSPRKWERIMFAEACKTKNITIIFTSSLAPYIVSNTINVTPSSKLLMKFSLSIWCVFTNNYQNSTLFLPYFLVSWFPEGIGNNFFSRFHHFLYKILKRVIEIKVDGVFIIISDNISTENENIK